MFSEIYSISQVYFRATCIAVLFKGIISPNRKVHFSNVEQVCFFLQGESLKKNNGWLFTHLQHCECSLRLRANGNFPLGRAPRQLQRHLHRYTRNTEGPKASKESRKTHWYHFRNATQFLFGGIHWSTLICIQIWASLMMNMDGLSPHQLQGPLSKKLVLLRSIDHFYRILVVPHFKTHMLYEQKIPVSDFLTILRSDSLMIWWFFSWFFSDQLSALALYCSSVSSTSNSPPPARFNFSTSCQDIWYMFHYYTLLTLLQIKKSKKYR